MNFLHDLYIPVCTGISQTHTSTRSPEGNAAQLKTPTVVHRDQRSIGHSPEFLADRHISTTSLVIICT